MNKKEIFTIGNSRKFKTNCLYSSAFLFSFLLLLTGCEEGVAERELSVAHGLIAEVSARSLTETRWFSLETDGGATFKVMVETDLGKFTPSHLRSHMITGQPVEVMFSEKETTSNLIIAVSVSDYHGN